MVQGGMAGYINHIYISPNMVQNVGDSSGEPLNVTNTASQESQPDNVDMRAKLAEARARTWGLKQQLKATDAAFDREREQLDSQLEEKETGRLALVEQINVMRELLRYSMDDREKGIEDTKINETLSRNFTTNRKVNETENDDFDDSYTPLISKNSHWKPLIKKDKVADPRYIKERLKKLRGRVQIMKHRKNKHTLHLSNLTSSVSKTFPEIL